MALTVPDYANASFVEQAGLDSVDIDALVAALDDSIVITGCLVTQRAAGATLSVDVAAGTIAVQGGLATVTAGNVAVTPDGTNPRWALISANSSGTLTATLGTAAASPVFPTIPASSVPLAAVWIPAAAGSILNANIVDKRPISAAPKVVASGAAGTSALLKVGRTADEYHLGIDVAAGEFSDSAAGDVAQRVLDNTKSIRWGFGASSTASRMQLTNTALILPVGQELVTGTSGVITGTRTTTTNASDTVDLGTFSTTGGAMALRITAHLVAPANGTTASVTKIYEIAAGQAMGTVSTWYLCLPADASANSAATNDFALEVQRPVAGVPTFQFRFRQKSIGAAGFIAFTVESLGDTAVTFTSSSTVTAAPTAVTTPHPSNNLVSSAGNIGIGTDSPGSPLTVLGPSGSAAVGNIIGPGTLPAFWTAQNAGNPFAAIGAVGAVGQGFTGTSVGDAVVGTSFSGGGGTVHIGPGIIAGTGSVAAVLKVSSSSVDSTVNVTAPNLTSDWASYTPVWTGATTNPSIGNGSITGAFKQQGKTVLFTITITWGSTTTLGTGSWFLSYPVTPSDWPMINAILNRAAGNITAMGIHNSSTGLGNFVMNSCATNAQVSSATTTWATGDKLKVTGVYRSA